MTSFRVPVSAIKIFILGGTGLMGGSFVSRLMTHALAKGFEISVLVRASSKAETLRALGLRAVVGSLTDLDLISKEAANADIVFSCANCDDIPSVKAILAGMKVRFESTGIPPSLIHTSGSATFADETNGMRASETIYSDLDIPLLETLASTQPHRPVDLEIVGADEKGYVKTYIVVPGLVYGRAKGLLVDLNVQNPKSVQIPALAQAAVARGQAGQIGAGENYWVNISISDLTDLFVILFDTVLATILTSVKPPAEFQHGREGYYFATTSQHRLFQISQKIAQVLEGAGIGSAQPTGFSDAEVAENPILTNTFLGANSRATSDRMKKLGWVAKGSGDDMLESIEEEVKYAMQARR